MLLIKPHTVTILPATEQSNLDGTGVQPPSFPTTGNNVDCMITPLSSTATFEKWGVICRRPHELMCELEDNTQFHVGDRVVWNDEIYTVDAEPRLWQVGDSCDSAVILISKGQFTN